MPRYSFRTSYSRHKAAPTSIDHGLQRPVHHRAERVVHDDLQSCRQSGRKGDGHRQYREAADAGEDAIDPTHRVTAVHNVGRAHDDGAVCACRLRDRPQDRHEHRAPTRRATRPDCIASDDEHRRRGDLMAIVLDDLGSGALDGALPIRPEDVAVDADAAAATGDNIWTPRRSISSWMVF